MNVRRKIQVLLELRRLRRGVRDYEIERANVSQKWRLIQNCLNVDDKKLFRKVGVTKEHAEAFNSLAHMIAMCDKLIILNEELPAWIHNQNVFIEELRRLEKTPRQDKVFGLKMFATFLEGLVQQSDR